MAPIDTALVPKRTSESTRVLVSDSPTGALRPFVEHVDVRLSSRGAPWDDALIVEVDELRPANLVNCYAPRPTVVVHLNNTSGVLERPGEHRDCERLPVTAGSVQFDPPGALTSARWTEPLKVLFLIPGEAIFQRALAEVQGPADCEFVRASHVKDPQISHIGRALLAECESGFGSGRLYGESMGLALVARLLSRYSTREIRFQAYGAGGLPLWRLRQVTEYIEENLGNSLRLSDLARVAHLSEFHFGRVFKQSTGVSPHRYVVNRRVQRGCELLIKGRMPLHEISAVLGFGDPSHFSTVFKKSTGVTPTQFRDRV